MSSILYDRIIDLKLTYRDRKAEEYWDLVDKAQITKTYELKCPRSSFKPKISFHWKRVEENFCYSITIKIANLNLNIDAIWIEDILITAGYIGIETHTASFHCTPFASYQESPGPDGVTTFECLVAEGEVGLFAQQSYSFTLFNKRIDKWTVRDVFERCQQQMGVKFIAHPGDRYRSATANTPAGRYSHKYLDRIYSAKNIQYHELSNGYEVIVEVQNTLNELFKAEGVEVTTIIFNDSVHFCFQGPEGTIEVESTDDKSKKFPTDELVYNLDRVNSVNWNAGTMSITAPWNPHIVPGSLFSINPYYYTGSAGLPNEVARQRLQADTFNIYYVLLQEVTFSTQSDNTMVIQAIPYSLSPKANQTTSETQEEDATTIDDYYSRVQNIVHIKLDGDEASDTDVKKLEDMRFSLASQYVTNYQIVQNDTLSLIIKDKFTGLKDLTGYIGAKDNIFTVPAYFAWFPVIMMLTYTQYQNELSKHVANPLFPMKLANPDDIQTGKFLIIPSGITWKQLQAGYKTQLVKIYNLCEAYYLTKGKESWAQFARLAAKLLEEGVLE